LIACLPNESKEILYKNGIIISSPILKPPLFNYVAFIKNLSTDEFVVKLLAFHLKTTRMMIIKWY